MKQTRLLAVVALLAIAACSGQSAAPESTDRAVAAPPTAPADINAGGEASTTAPDILQFSADLVGGGTIDLAAFGDRPVLLWFWAPW